MNEQCRVRGRFAPSPTGPLHLGSLAAALASYFLAKSQSGQWIIRIEDLDPPREIAGMAVQQLASLAAFGLESDLPVVWQSTRSELYEAALKTLSDNGMVFHCSCTRSQLHDQNGIHHRCVAPINPSAYAIRLRAAKKSVRFDDGIYGSQTQDLYTDVGDIVLKRVDGLYAYQLAVVVDDFEQGINQIVRGADLLDSTPRQVFLQQLLGMPGPAYFHIPLVLDEAKHKLSKSQWAASLDEEDRFHAFSAACMHLGQDTRPLSRQNSMARNLALALEHFSLLALKQTTVRG